MIPELCARCEKPRELCVCDRIHPIETKLQVLILQHPQEPDKRLGTARIAQLMLPSATLKIGLSWPNLRSALGQEVMPSKWAVLYLGSGVKGKITHAFQLVNKAGEPLPNASDVRGELEGLVVLDGTWSQAKALWWRNAWLLKLRRAVLSTSTRSLYRELRREPRKECLSTIESIGASLSALGEPESTEQQLRSVFADLLERERLHYRTSREKGAS